MRILKIANLTNTRNSGMGRVMHMTADEMRDMGHEVEFLFSADVPRLLPGMTDRISFPFSLVKAVKHRIRVSGGFDIIEIHEPSAAWYCYCRRRDKRLPPCVLMSHGLEEAQWLLRQNLAKVLRKKISRKSQILVPLTLLSQAKYGLKHCQQIMCLNSYDEQYLKNALNIPSNMISRVQNGVAPTFFDNQRVVPLRERSILFVGSWLERKGNFILAEAFDKLHNRDPKISLTLMGTGFFESEVLACFSPSSRSSVRVMPRADDAQLRDAYYSHSIFAFPSYFEPWGLVLMEAAAAGMALVTTCTGGPQDLFSNDENALLIEPLNAAHLEAALWELVANASLRERLGRKAKEHVAQFTWRAAAVSQLRAYERAIQVAMTE